MKTKVSRTFYFDAAHAIKNAEDSKCEELHGHTYRLDVEVSGPLKNGMVIDFNNIKGVVQREILPELDHKNLGKIIENPTAENIAVWILNRLKPCFNVSKVRVWEGRGKFAEVEP